MHLRTTIILLVLTGGLLAWVLLHERKGPPQSVNGMLLFDFDGSEEEAALKAVKPGQVPDDKPRAEVRGDEITQIDLKNSAGLTSFKRRKDGSWAMTKGLKDRADRGFVTSLLRLCETAVIIDTLPREEVKRGDISESSLGLDASSRVEVTFRKDGARIAEIHVGRTAPLGGSMYVSVDNAQNDWHRRRPDIYLVTPDLRDKVARPLDSFRDPNVSPWTPDKVQKVEIVRGDRDGKLEILRDTIDPQMEAPWYIASPFRTRADQTVVTQFLQILCATRINAFKPAQANVATPDSAAKPLAQVTLWTSPEIDRKGCTLIFSPDPTDAKRVLCRDVERKAEYFIERGLIDDICATDGANTFRDPFLGLGGIPEKLLTSVNITPASGDAVELVRIGAKWSVRRKDTGVWEAAEASKLEVLLKQFDKTEILEFSSDSMTDPALFGLAQPMVSITFGAPVHSSLENLGALTPQNSRVLRLGMLPDGKCFANYEGEPFVYRVPPETIGDVPRQYIKWRRLALPTFSLQQVRRIKQTVGTEPPVELKNDGRSSIWTATRGAEDVTSQVQALAVGQLVSRLGSLEASNWQISPELADEALKIPAVTLEVDLEIFENNSSRIEPFTLTLAPMHPGQRTPLYHGRHSKVPDAFLMDRTLADLFMRGLIRRDPAAGE